MNDSRWRHFVWGMLALLFPIAGIGWWIYVSETHDGSHAETVDAFMQPFPAFIAGPVVVTLIQMAFCGMAILFFYKGLDERGLPKFVNLLALGLSGLIAAWLLFSLM